MVNQKPSKRHEKTKIHIPSDLGDIKKKTKSGGNKIY